MAHEWICTPEDFLRGLRSRLRLTQSEVAKKAAVDRGLIAKIEGNRDVRIGTLAKIAQALGLELVIGVRSTRSLIDMAEDHVPARLDLWEARLRRREAIRRSSRGSPS